jgi:hypothetical protein
VTASTLALLINRPATLTTAEGLKVSVRVADARERFGRTDVLVTPIAGAGAAWVSMERVEIARIIED